MPTPISRPIVEVESLGNRLTETWEMYCRIFKDVNAMAAQRHLMYWEEFVDMNDDPNIIKLMALTEEDKLVGMATLTNKLSSWSLISPEYFEKHWPEHYEQQRIWYVGFVGVEKNARGILALHTFRKLVVSMYNHVISNNGIVFMDFCMFNSSEVKIPQRTLQLLQSIDKRSRSAMVDAQQFWGYRFDGEELK